MGTRKDLKEGEEVVKMCWPDRAMRKELEEELEEARRNVSRLEYLLSSSQIEATQAVEKREAENERQV